MPARPNRWCQHHRHQQRSFSRPARPLACSAAAGSAPAALSEAQAAFDELAAQHAGSCAVALRPSLHGQGLFLAREAAAGEVVLSVPSSTCITIDYATGLHIPQVRLGWGECGLVGSGG